MLRKDGSTVWVEVTTTLVRDEQGRALSFVNVTRDVTGRKRIFSNVGRESDIAQARSAGAAGYLVTPS